MKDGYRKAKPKKQNYQTKISEAPKNPKSEVVYRAKKKTKMTAAAPWAI
jgi:hypothetical protein